MNKISGLAGRMLLLPLLMVACSQPSNEQSYDSFDKFAGNLSLVESESCARTCTAFKKEFRYLVYIGEKIYCYWNEKQIEYKVDFKQKGVEFEDQITNKTTHTDYFILLVKWASLFRDGHVNAMLRSDVSDLEFYPTDIRFEMLAPGTDHEKLIISRVGASISTLKVGTVITKIQDKAWTEYSNEAEKFTTGSTLQMRRKQVGNNIFRVLLEKDGPLAVKISGLYNGKEISEVVARNLQLADGATEPDEPVDTGINYIKSSVLENNIGYLRIDEFDGTQMPKLMDQAMDRLAATAGIIIDVRRNGGGDLSGNTILARLIGTPIDRFHQRATFSDMINALRPSNLFDYEYKEGAFTEMKARKVVPAAPEKQYKKPVLVLTSGNCFSACDTFVSAIKENKLGTIMGEATGGGTGNPMTLSLPMSEHLFRYSVAQGFTAVTRQLLEGAGTQPDVILEPTVEERAQGKDIQLVKALQYFSSKIEGKSIVPVSLPESLLTVKTEIIKKAYEIERDREIRRSKD